METEPNMSEASSASNLPDPSFLEKVQKSLQVQFPGLAGELLDVYIKDCPLLTEHTQILSETQLTTLSELILSNLTPTEDERRFWMHVLVEAVRSICSETDTHAPKPDQECVKLEAAILGNFRVSLQENASQLYYIWAGDLLMATLPPKYKAITYFLGNGAAQIGAASLYTILRTNPGLKQSLTQTFADLALEHVNTGKMPEVPPFRMEHTIVRAPIEQIQKSILPFYKKLQDLYGESYPVITGTNIEDIKIHFERICQPDKTAYGSSKKFSYLVRGCAVPIPYEGNDDLWNLLKSHAGIIAKRGLYGFTILLYCDLIVSLMHIIQRDQVEGLIQGRGQKLTEEKKE